APIKFSEDVDGALTEIRKLLTGAGLSSDLDWYSLKVLERDEKVIKELKLPENIQEKAGVVVEKLEDKYDDDSESIITSARYEAIESIVSKCVRKGKTVRSWSDRIDAVVTNRFLALPIFAVAMFAVYYISVSWLGTIVTDWTNDTLFAETIQPAVTSWLTAIGCAPWLIGLIVDGCIGGVGAVLGFVPQMMILFILLSILEDCGYMARVAFIMDRIFRKFGLSGKSFIPMLISSGCGVPGVMACKTIENEKDRRMTVMTTTFIPCGAKLPVIALIGGAMFPEISWLAPAIYFIGIGAVLLSGIILKKTKMFAGDPAPFVMELPAYHVPAPKGVLLHMWERAKSFIIKAGTIIFLACGVIWFLSNFGFGDNGFGMVDTEVSLLAVIGSAIAPIFAPLGFGDWQSTVATVTGLVAKENVVGTFGVLFGLGEVAEDAPGLLAQIALLFPYGAAALSFLIFNMLCAPCFAAIGAIRREMASAKWTWFAIGYQTVLAYSIALIVNQIGGLLTGALSFGIGTVIALILLALLIFLLVRPAPKGAPLSNELAVNN
ncbi:MAG: ferrous iron transport protein B, partial [Bacillota bacterium]|nr:ferrous iron transport protein B [Bacillota bacterium]